MILALDTSQVQAAVALLEDGRPVASETGGISRAHSEALLPLVDRVLKASGRDLRSLDAFAVGIGPGSFTGIRVGCATVKALAQVTGKPVLAFSSLEALAFSAGSDRTRVVAMANAYQSQVFAGWLSPADGLFVEEAVSAAAWCEAYLADLAAAGPVTLCGTGAAIYFESAILPAAAKLGIPATRLTLLDSVQHVSPEGISRVVAKADREELVHYSGLRANYMRPSQAEIKLLESTTENGTQK